MINTEILEVKAASDHLSRISSCTPLTAIEELIWNGCDADATHIQVTLVDSELEGLSRIVIEDNGTGIEYNLAKQVFGVVGGSPKSGRPSSVKGRLLHGKEGRGRYKAIALGSTVTWHSRVAVLDGSVEEFSVRILEGGLARPAIDRPVSSKHLPGCIVEIEDVKREGLALLDPETPTRLASRFASYLRGNPDVSIYFNEHSVNPDSSVDRVFEDRLEVAGPDRAWSAKVSVFFWKNPGLNELFFCRENGAAVEEVRHTRSIKGLSFSVYIASEYFDVDTVGGYTLFDDLDNVAKDFKDGARKFLRKCARELLAEQAQVSLIELRQQGLYPYEGEPTTQMEKAEREVFDIAAAKIVELSPLLMEAGEDEKRIKLQVLKVAIENAPSARDRIIREVFKLGNDELEDFAELLDRVELSALVSLAKTVTGRLDFLSALHLLAYNVDSKKRLRERSQLHKILLRDLWLFGEQYALGRSDNSLRNVLKEHLKILGRETLDWEREVPEDVSLDDIPDLMLFRMIPNGIPGHYDHLIVEIKRPSVKLGRAEFDQIIDYADVVSQVGAFDKTRTRWKFIVVSSEVDKAEYRKKATGKDKPDGLLVSHENYDVYAYTWGSLIQDARHRMEFIRDSLKYDVDDQRAANFLLKNHEAILAGKHGDSPIIGLFQQLAEDKAAPDADVIEQVPESQDDSSD